VVVGVVHMLRARARRGDAAAAARLPLVASMAITLSIAAVIFAVMTFN
jgi:hypothetical protein